MTVHASVRNQTEQMQSMIARFLEALLEDGIVCQFARGERLVNPRQILINDPARAKIQVPNFGVSHLPLRQSDILSARAYFPHRILSVELIVKGRARQQGGIAIFPRPIAAAGIDSPTITNDQHHWPAHRAQSADRARPDKRFPMAARLTMRYRLIHIAP